MNIRATRSLLASTILASTALWGSLAAAQTSAPPPSDSAEQVASPTNDTSGDEIVITGIRQSLGAARDIKRDATQFVDAIVSDDIGKLPDRNVAESLARVSGLQVDRGIGEGTNVSVRGLRQNVYLFNGREIVDATGRGGTGLDQLGSSTYGILALVPSELISKLEVTKLAGADQIAGALGGIIDIETRKPLDGANAIAARAAVGYDDLTEKPSYEVFGLVSRKFADDTFGVLVSASYQRRRLAQQGLDTFAGYTRFATGTTARYGNSDVRPEEIDEKRTKLGLDAVVQWRPSPSVEMTLDSFYSKLTSDRDRFWLSFNPLTGLSNAKYSSNNVLLSGTAATPVLTNTEFADTKADTWSSALRGAFELSDTIKGSAEVSYNKSTSSYRQIYFRLQPLATITPSVNFDLGAGDFGSYNVSGINLTDPAQLRFTIFFQNLYRAETEATAARTDWSAKLGEGFLNSLGVGFRYQNLDTQTRPELADIRPTGGIPATQLSSFLVLHNNPGFAKGEFAGLPRSFLTSSEAVLPGCSVFTNFPAVSQAAACTNPAGTTNALAGTYEIKEKFYEGYGKLDFQSDLGGLDLRGNVGVRYLHRELTSIGNLINSAGGATPTTFRRNDDEWLPSATAKLNLSDSLLLRIGAAKVVAFPNSADLNNGLTLFNTAVFVNGVQTTPGTGNGGAPNLNPYRANQVDGSLEYYFGRQALASVGVFYKDVSTFIVSQQSAETYAGVNYLINRRLNGDGAKVKGVEALLQLPFYFLPAPLDGFGVVATYSYIDSSTPIRDGVGRVLPFPGLSKNNVNLIGYYEKGPVSVRVAYNWRDDYLVSLSAANTGIYNDTYTDLSTTVRFDISDNFSLNLEANNLLNEKQRTYDGSREALRTNLFFGRMYKAGISLKF